jgi:methyl halide transferase
MVEKAEYWSQQYLNQKHGWDIRSVSTPLKAYFDQLTDKSIDILVPGAGFGWEVAYLFQSGFKNVKMLDFAPEAVEIFKRNFPDFPISQILIQDFFQHSGSYDLIVEQTFFSGISPAMRKEYASKCYSLLKENGKIAGLLFNHEFQSNGPPFGGTLEEYEKIFAENFIFKKFETSYNSIKPRAERELFFIFQKK